MPSIALVPNVNLGDLTLIQAATAQTLLSPAFPPTQALGVGTMIIVLNSSSASAPELNITIDASNNTIQGIADAINSAATSANIDIAASVLNSTDGSHIILQSYITGVANGFSISVALGTDTGISQLVVTTIQVPNAQQYPITATDGQPGFTQIAAAQDAYFDIGGRLVSSPSNTVLNVISGHNVVISA